MDAMLPCQRFHPVSLLLLTGLLVLGAGSCAVKPAPQPETLRPAAALPALTPPRLVLLVVIDQARGDLFDRFGPVLTGGLARLNREGVVFTQARHDHARTLTAPGHASLATGLHPSHHGVIGNRWFDRNTGSLQYCVEDPVHERSPALLQGSTLGDWLKDHEPEAHVHAIAGKDRAAILMGGHAADGAYWFDDGTGDFISSTYYAPDVPPWLTAFNERKVSDVMFGQTWEPLPVDMALLTQPVVNLDEGPFSTRFPRALGNRSTIPGPGFYSDIYESPFLDRAVFLLARDLVTQEGLGTHDHTDLLAIGLSALDMVGHVFGPDSPEYLDTVLRLDRELGELFAFLEDHIGGDGVMVALSSDHGVLPIPESPTLHGEPGRHFTTSDVTCLQNAGRHLTDGLSQGDWLLSDGYLNRDLITAEGLDEAQVERAMADILEGCVAVEKVWTRDELRPEEPSPHPLTALVINNTHPQRSPDLFLQLKPGVLGWIGRGTTHGSPYEYDRHVPMVIMVPGDAPQQVNRPVRTVDLAPTLAAIMGLTPPDGLDGRNLSPWLIPSGEEQPD